MSSLRKAIEDPATLDFSQATRQPLSFLASPSLPPVLPGGTRAIGPGVVTTQYPWGIEYCLEQGSPVEFYLVRYILPVTELDYIVAYCLGSVLEGIRKVMVGRDYGAQVSDAVAAHWPTTTRLLLNGHLWDLNGPAFIRIETSETQWSVAQAFAVPEDQSDFTVPDQTVAEVSNWAFEALEEIKDGLLAIPNIVQIFGGPDATARHLDRSARAIDLIGDIGEAISKLLG